MISRDALNQFGGTDPEPDKSAPSGADFDMRGFLALHGFKVLREKPWASHPGGMIYELDHCPFNPDHTHGSAAFTESGGVPGFSCKHDGCAGRTIKDVFATHPPKTPEPLAGAQTKTQAQVLISLAGDVELFHTPAGEAYARFRIGTHFEIARIGHKSFRQWFIKRFFDAYRKPPGTQALQEAAGVLDAKARFDGSEIEVAVRVAGYEGRIYIDLCNKDWDVIEISIEGWKVVSDPPVRFRRTSGMRALPRPEPGGSLGRLRGLINIGDEDNWILLSSWLVATCRPNGPFPILVLQGEQGSAKSTLERIIRMIIDPSIAPVRTPPKVDRDLLIAATNSWVIAYDNLSAIPQWLSDALCRLATGGGFSTRELYSDSDEAIFNAMRPVILNGIDHLTERADLAERSVILNLPRIAEQNRRTEKQVYEEFERELPRILGAIYTAVSVALKLLPNTIVEGMPRMADFAVWATAAEGAMGFSTGQFLKAYQGNRADSVQETLDGDPIAVAISAFMEEQHHEGRQSWTGNCKELMPQLNRFAEESVKKSDAWPKSHRALSGRLRCLVTFLRESGIDIVFPPKGTKASQGKRLLKITRTTSQKTATTATSANDSSGFQSVTEDDPSGGPGDQVADEARYDPQPPPASAEPGPLNANGKQTKVVVDDNRNLRGTPSTREEDQLYRCAKCGLVDWTWNGNAWVCPHCGEPAPGQRVPGADTERFEL